MTNVITKKYSLLMLSTIILPKDIQKQETGPNPTSTGKTMGAAEGWGQKGVSGQPRLLPTICQEVTFAGKRGTCPAAKCRHTQRRSLLHEPILRDHPNSFPFACVGWEKEAFLYCYKVALFPAVVFTSVSMSSRAHFVICSSWCLSCEPREELLGWEDWV